MSETPRLEVLEVGDWCIYDHPAEAHKFYQVLELKGRMARVRVLNTRTRSTHETEICQAFIKIVKKHDGRHVNPPAIGVRW